MEELEKDNIQNKEEVNKTMENIADDILNKAENTDKNDAPEINTDLSIEQKLIQEIQDQKDKYIRLLAEFENYKRRTAKERIDLISSAGKDILTNFLDVLDDCERAEKNLLDETKSIQIQQEGILLVFNKFKSIMQAKGVKQMNCIGEIFEVEKHEAITEIQTTDDMKGKVVDELIKGYYLNDKIIRYAKVVIGK